MRVFEQINAPVGELGMTSLYVADSTAKSGDATDDAAFTTTSAAWRHVAKCLADEGEALLAEVAQLAGRL